jgi:hypothetical protein
VSALEIPTPWQIIEDAKGFLHIHHPNEDDGETQGDLVATVFQDERHAHLMKASPELLAACRKLDAFWSADYAPPHPDPAKQELRLLTKETLDVWRTIRAAIARATGADA